MHTEISDSQANSAPNFISRMGRRACLQSEADYGRPRRPAHSKRDPVLAGAPPGWPRSQAWSNFHQDLASSGDRPILFGLEPQDLKEVAGWTISLIGRQPLFEAGPSCTSSLSGETQPHSQRYLRRQARRTARKGVSTARISAEAVWILREEGAFDHLLWQRWLGQVLPEFSFLVALDWTANLAHRRFFLSRNESGEILALTLLLKCDRGWLLEHQLLSQSAPNGTTEQVLCYLLSEDLEAGEWLSLGLTPLIDDIQDDPGVSQTLLAPIPRILRKALFQCWEPLYGFQRLATFRGKLEPQLWEPVYWAHPPQTPRLIAIWNVLRTFAGGSLLAFTARFILKGAQKSSLRFSLGLLKGINLFFLLSLLLWVPILMHLDSPTLFGHPQGAKVWACYDLLLILGFAWHHKCLTSARTDQHGVFRSLLIGLVFADAALSWFGTLWLFGGLPADLWQAAFLGAINSAPILGLLFLCICQIRPGHSTTRGSSFSLKGGGMSQETSSR